MYRPSYFACEDLSLLHQLMREHPLATLVTLGPQGLMANSFPLLLRPEEGERGTLYGHMARANSQWKDFASSMDALVAFHGPHAYVSPSWYAPDVHVPTWNYAAVHAYGRPELMPEEETYRVLEELVRLHESGFERPWRLDLPEPDRRELLGAIVGFRMRIERLEGKLKLSQNRTPEDRRRVAMALGMSRHPGDRAVAALMERVPG